MKKLAILAASLVLAAPATANAAQMIFFGENPTPGNAVSGDPATARAQFLAQLTAGVSTESFESYPSGTVPGSLTFNGTGGAINAALQPGSGSVQTGPNGAGRFATSGSQYFEVDSDFEINFSQSVAAFGFYGTDIGDFSGQVTLELLRMGMPNEVLIIPNTINGPDGSLLFYGVIDTDNPFDGLQFGNTAPGTDFFGFDDLTIGDVGQVTGGVPEPTTWAMLLFGFGAIGSAMRSRRRQNTTVRFA